MFSLTLAQALARQGKALYLNLENCSGLEALLKANWREDLADLIHVCASDRGNLSARLEGIVRQYGNLDICPPSFFPEDLRETGCTEWMQFFASLSQAGSYQAMVLDIGDQIKDIPELLRMCEKVFFPVLPDPVSRSKISQFEKNLDAMSMEDLRRSLIRLYLPAASVRSLGSSLLDDLMFGAMGQFVQQLISEEL
jgi:hypothetical protein